MGGILKFLPIEEASIASIRAGMDLLEICHSPELILRAYESLITEAERSVVFRDLLLLRARQTSMKQRKLFAGRASVALSTKQFEALRVRILRFNEAIAKAQPKSESDQA
jgi:beta-N-acetylhexosaminidase